MDVLQLARPMTYGVQILVLQREEVLGEALIGKPGAHALPGRRADPKAPSARLRLAHRPGVRFI